MRPSLFAARHATTIGAFALAALLFLIGTAARSSFASSANIIQLLVFASFIGLVAMGQTAVILGGGFDLSLPWVIGLGGILLSQFTADGMPGGVAVMIVIASGALVGLVNGLGVTRLRVSPIIMTLVVGGLVEAYLLSVGLGQATGSGVPKVATDIASRKVAGIPVVVLVWAVLAVLFGLLLARTTFGRRLYATGTNDRAAAIAGVRIRRVRTLTYVISGATAAFGGVILAGYFGQAYVTMGSPYLFASIAAVAVGGASVLGGQGTYWGTVAGALTLTFLGALLPIFNLDNSTLQIVYGVVILVGVAFARFAAAFSRRGAVTAAEAGENPPPSPRTGTEVPTAPAT